MGVYFAKKVGRFHARRYYRGKNYHIGYFDTLDEAEKADEEWIPPRDIVPVRGPKEIDFVGEGASFIPPKVKNPHSGKTRTYFERYSRQQVKDLTAKYGPKRRSEVT